MERFEFTFSSTTSEPPTGSQLRLNNTDPALATRLWVRNLTGPGEDVHALLMALPVGSLLYVQDYDDHTRRYAYQVAFAAVDKVDYVEFPLTYLGAGLPLLSQKIALVVVGPADSASTSQTYASVDELAAALRIRVTAENRPGLQACVDAAAEEINQDIDRRTDEPVLPNTNGWSLANRVNILRGVEWFKSQDAAFGILGLSETGQLLAPRDAFNRHAYTLTPLKQQWGVA